MENLMVRIMGLKKLNGAFNGEFSGDENLVGNLYTGMNLKKFF